MAKSARNEAKKLRLPLGLLLASVVLLATLGLVRSQRGAGNQLVDDEVEEVLKPRAAKQFGPSAFMPAMQSDKDVGPLGRDFLCF